MNDIKGSYNLGFVVAGAFNVAACFVLALIPYAQRSRQTRKSIMNVTINQNNEIMEWTNDIPLFTVVRSNEHILFCLVSPVFHYSRVVVWTRSLSFRGNHLLLVMWTTSPEPSFGVQNWVIQDHPCQVLQRKAKYRTPAKRLKDWLVIACVYW